MIITIGIDIGLTGAICAIDAHGQAHIHDLPVIIKGKDKRIDGRELILLLRHMVAADQAGIAVIEDVRPRPMGNGNSHGNSMHSQGSLMRSRGIVEAVLDIARLGVIVVQPATWKRTYGLIGKGKGEAKDVACRLYPAAAPMLKRVKDHNRADGLLLAHYGRMERA